MGYVNQREAYGNTLVELGKKDDRIIVLDADLGGSTFGKLFEKEFPDRHIEVSIAEANMLSIAGGMAASGKIPFANSFAVFAAGRAYDQIRQTISIGKLNVKVGGSSAGLSDFGDGATHQSVEDIAIMRAIPNMTVLCPADANEMVEAVKAMAAYDGPCYVRVNRNDYPNTTTEGEPFVIGKPKIMREGSDIAVFAIGYMLNLALEAAEELKNVVSVKVINMSTIKPIDKKSVLDAISDVKGIVTVEEHSVIGGLGSAIAESICEAPKPIKMIGMQDTFGISAHDYASLLNHFGFTKEHVKETILGMWNGVKE